MKTPDWLPDFKAWLKAQPTIGGAISGRVFFRLPSQPLYPCMRVYQSGGGVQQSGDVTPIYDRRVGIEVLGGDLKQYAQVRQLTLALEDALNFAGPGPLNPPAGETYLLNAWVTAIPESPDPATGWPRFVADAVLTVRSA